MFVEDVGLLRKKGFSELLSRCLNDPKRFTSEMDDLWHHMDRGGYSPGIGERLLRFNGKLFKAAAALPLTVDEIRLLRHASDVDWRDLEPAIFGTLFEQALDPVERKRPGAHYTPRAYVERVIDATIMEPLTQDWIECQSAAERRSPQALARHGWRRSRCPRHGPLSAEQIASQFKNQHRIMSEIEDVLVSLNRLGEVETFDNGRSYVRAVS